MMDLFHLGGDQMTAARMRDCQRNRKNGERCKHRLYGYTAAVEEWHAKVTLLGVCSIWLTFIIYYAKYTTVLSFVQTIWKSLHKVLSGRNGGTLHYLSNSINQCNVTKNPANNVTASEDFILLITESHIAPAA